MYCEVMKAKLLNQDELELGERTAISRKSETLISLGFYYGQLLFIIFINDSTLQRGYPSFC